MCVFSTNLTGFSFDPATVVTDGNKGYKLATFCALHGLEPSEVVVVGDDRTDLGMIELGNPGILMVPLAADIQEGRAASRLRTVQEEWSRIPAVVISNTFAELTTVRLGQ